MTNPNNVTPIESKRPQASATHTISYLLDGFPVTTTIETTADIQAVIDRLKAIGAQPPQSNNHDERLKQTDDAPTCEYHGAMKASTKRPGSWFCSHKMGDGSYCKSKA